MKSYRDLDIYKESKRLGIEVHRMSLQLPKFELFEEGSQIRRSSKSVTALIVEGFGRRRYKSDFVKYLIHAHAECDETIVHLGFLFETRSMTNEDAFHQLTNDYILLSKRINNFTQWVESKMQPVHL